MIEGIRNFEGGVVLVSHDARLIELADDLWVCDGPPLSASSGTTTTASGGQVWLEKLGFVHYRRQRLALIAREAARVAEVAKARMAKKAESRRKRAVERAKKVELARQRRERVNA